ncbi:PREDICTED: putative polypeptide N-acetylgalactosaminyltransferase 9 [Priapulus caudatus]|uniref:Polypeptide N-acetylgalactosaminyltransferase n=1 Tax=Priapulus caudatus TaxID=37621 RepID=A0ABM1DTU4_PRICU|nr:PREDICTED: putative polypeptide N-acetylgalactosaminyltransferase 9 [Priapulus caudatus]
MVLGSRVLRRSCRNPCVLFAFYTALVLVVVMFVIKLPRDSSPSRPDVVVMQRGEKNSRLAADSIAAAYDSAADNHPAKPADVRQPVGGGGENEKVADDQVPKPKSAEKVEEEKEEMEAEKESVKHVIDAPLAKPFEPVGPRTGKYGNKTLIIDPVAGGPGDMGKGYLMKTAELTPEEKKLYDEGMAKNSFNEYLSDLVSLRRRLPDMRHETCLKRDYVPLSSLPSVSVIIIFHNEALSVLLRTVHSVLDRSPPEILKEVILVDDYSERSHMGKPLQQYVDTLEKVTLLRAKKREGLIRVRLLGGKHATGKVLVYLDSHCECTEGWLVPLVDVIARNVTSVAVPVIEVINVDSLEYNHGTQPEAVQVGGFSWGLVFNWHSSPKSEKAWRTAHSLQPLDPVRSPTMAGGLFAIDKEWFEKLGTYDPEFDVWGGENLEISFKIGCARRKLSSGSACSPCRCSIFRRAKFARHKVPQRISHPDYYKNLVRLAEVWLDDYKEYFLAEHVGVALKVRGKNYGDLTSRKALRKRLKCKSFGWYLNSIWPEMFHPGKAIYGGEIRNSIGGGAGDACLDSPSDDKQHGKLMTLWPCHNQRGNQQWHMTPTGELRREDLCLDFDGKKISMWGCHGLQGNQQWEYDKTKLTLYHTNSKKCIQVKDDRKSMFMEECNASPQQQWKFESTGWRKSTVK